MKANAEIQEGGSIDILKWGAVFVLLVAAVVGNNLYSEVAFAIRASCIGVLVLAALGVAAWTSKGRIALSFAQESRMEVRKVVWPTRQETVNTTFIVLAATVVMALFLWGIDGIMVRLVRLITGV